MEDIDIEPMTKEAYLAGLKFTIEDHSKWNVRYWGNGDNYGKPITHENHDIYSNLDFSTFRDQIHDMLDYPDEPMTEAEVQKHFSSRKLGKISDENVKGILCYYNGRLELSKKIFSEVEAAIKDFTNAAVQSGKPICENFEYKYTLPEELSSFTVYDSEDFPEEKMVFHTVTITIHA